MKKAVKTFGTLGLLGCAVIASPSAVADDSGWYVGTNIGQSRAKIGDAQITSTLQGGGFTNTSIVDDNRSTGYKLFGGYKFNKNFALEGGYFDLGKFGYTATTAAPMAGTLTDNFKLYGINIDAVGMLPITEKFSVFGRVGLNYAEARNNFSSTGAVPVPPNFTPSKREVNHKLGLGVQYNFTESLAMRVETERYRINDAVGNKGDIDLISLGLVYRFGEKTPAPAPVQKVDAPEPVAPEPAAITPEPKVAVVMPPPPPPPQVTPPSPSPQLKAATQQPPSPEIVMPPPPPPPPPTPPKKVIFSSDSTADALFGFGKATMKPGGQQALDKFAADLRGANFEVVTVTGHTDRIGSHAYNMKLSTSRAEAVKTYLVKSADIPASKIAAKGVDGSDPVTKPGECQGKKATRKLIDCLQPDRRVEVEVTATRTAK